MRKIFIKNIESLKMIEQKGGLLLTVLLTKGDERA